MSQSLGGAGVVSIPTYPANNRVPGVFSVVDASKANTGLPAQRGLIVAQMLSSGSAAPNVAVVSAGVGDAQTAGGQGSQLALAVERWRAIDPTAELWILPVADAGGGTAATATITFTGPATAPGSIPLMIDFYSISVPVNSGDTATTMAANTAAAINAFVTPGLNLLPMTAAASAGVVTITQRNKGTLGNQSQINLSFYGTVGGQGQPGSPNVAGVTATVTAFTGGATDPTFTTALANLPAKSFDFIAVPYNDATSLNAFQAFLSDASGRWNWANELFGGVFTAKGGTLSARTTWSTARNDQHALAIGAWNSPSPDWHWAIDVAAAIAVSIRSDPAVPPGGLGGGGVALNVGAPPLANRDTFAERETLLFDGMSTYVVDASGTVRIDRAITSYQTNPAGSPDTSYLNINVPYMLAAWIRARNQMISSRFSGYGLVADGSRIPAGLKRTTAQLIAQSVVSLYRRLTPSLMQNADQFAKQITWQNAGGGVVKLLEPVQLADQLIVVACNVQFTQP